MRRRFNQVCFFTVFVQMIRDVRLMIHFQGGPCCDRRARKAARQAERRRARAPGLGAEKKGTFERAAFPVALASACGCDADAVEAETVGDASAPELPALEHLRQPGLAHLPARKNAHAARGQPGECDERGGQVVAGGVQALPGDDHEPRLPQAARRGQARPAGQGGVRALHARVCVCRLCQIVFVGRTCHG